VFLNTEFAFWDRKTIDEPIDPRGAQLAAGWMSRAKTAGARQADEPASLGHAYADDPTREPS
jgi:hypothetical protein